MGRLRTIKVQTEKAQERPPEIIVGRELLDQFAVVVIGDLAVDIRVRLQLRRLRAEAFIAIAQAFVVTVQVF